MMKGKLMKSLFRGKAVPRTPGPQGEDPENMDPDRLTRLRVHSEEHNSTNSLDSPCSESPKSWPSTFTTPMNYIKGKKRKHSRFHIPSPLEHSGGDDVFGVVEEHNLSHQSINSDAVSFLSFNDSATGEHDVEDGIASSKRQQQDNGSSSNGSSRAGGKSAAKLHSEQQEMYIQQLLQQLDVQQKLISDYEMEKKRYEDRVQSLTSDLGDRTSEARALREEMHVKKRLEITVQDLRERLQHLEAENRNLQQRVNEASPLTDHQKELLLHNRMKSCSAPPSIMAGSLDGQAGGAGLADSGEELSCEWEVKSSGGSSVHSEVSVACLQDKLVQMEENNYSTHEELQATLQELTDLQHQLEELQSENRTLSDEKSLLYESLCEQTDKLEACRSQLESTRQLLLQKEEEGKEQNPDRERKLLDVLKSAQDERDRLESKANDLSSTVDELRTAAEATSRETTLMQERMCFLERTLHTVRMEKEHKERELNDLKNDLSVKMMELSRLQTLNENFKAKLEELEAARDAVDKTEIEAKLDELRREKDGLEVVLNEKSQQVDKLEFEQNKLRDQTNNQKQELEFQIKTKTEEIEMIKNTAAKLTEEKKALIKDMEELQSSVAELEVKCQHHLSDKRELRANLSEIQKTNSDLQSRITEIESQLSSERTRRISDADEWKQFQADLLISVRVANDFQERVRTLEAENDRLKMAAIAKTQTTTRTNNTTTSPSQTADLTNLRTKYLQRTQDNKATVKGLIDSIESAAKAKTASYSRSSSTPTMPTLSPISEHPSKPVFTPSTPTQIKDNPSTSGSTNASPLTTADAETSASPVSILSNKSAVNRHLRMYDTPSVLVTTGGGCDPLSALVKNGGSKRNALLKWCQSKTTGYVDVDITNFSSSWNDGMAFCALLHTYIPDKIPYSTLKQAEKRRNFTIAFTAAESVGIPTTLNLTEMVSIERPDWQQIMTYVTNIYKYFET